MTLGINSTSNTQLILTLGETEKFVTHASPREQDILSAIEEFLTQEKINLQDLTEIEVAPGPGKFTSLRVGVAVAQALSFALNIPINGQPAGSSIEPEYGAEPNITQSKKVL